MNALHHLSVTEAGSLIATRKLSPVELVEAVLAQIDAVDGKIHSYITVIADRARKQAELAEAEIMAGRWRGPLHGIPFAVKDNYLTAGIRTTGASRLMLDHVPTETATCVQQLEAGGAILMGKLNCWEYGTGGGGFFVYDDLPFPLARNPWTTIPAAPRPAPGPAFRRARRCSPWGRIPAARCVCRQPPAGYRG